MGLFHHSSNHANHTCPMPSLSEDAAKPFIANMSFHHFNIILSGACTAFSCLVIFMLMAMHATHLSKPSEQIKIMKICNLIPLYSLFSFLSICFPHSFAYLNAWLDVFQSIALGSFFLLMCEFISPSDSERDLFFAALRVPQKENKPTIQGLQWFRKQWIAIFQYPVVALVAAVAADITQAAGVFCLESSKPYFAHLWIAIAQNVSVSFAVLAVVKFYTVLRTHLKEHQPLAKLLAFKLIVGLVFLENVIFSLLRTTKALKPTSTLTYADINIGIPTLVVCVQMVPFSIFFHYAYKVTPYLLSTTPPTGKDSQSQLASGTYYSIKGSTYQGGVLGVRAWLVFMNPMEIVRAIWFAFRIVGEARRGTSYDDNVGGLEPVRSTGYGGGGIE